MNPEPLPMPTARGQRRYIVGLILVGLPLRQCLGRENSCSPEHGCYLGQGELKPGAVGSRLELPAQLLRHETARELEREISAGGIPRARSRPLNRFLWRSLELDRDAQARGEASRDGFYDAGRRCFGSFHDAFAPAPGREQLLGKKGMYGKAEDENEGIWRAREGE